MHIVIDARESGTSTGRYVDNLIKYLQLVDKKNSYTLLYKPARIDQVQVTNDNFKKVETKYREFSFGEQIGLLLQIRSLKPDLVHFPLVQHPILYSGKKVVGMLDLTTLRFNNPAKNIIIFKIKQFVYRFVNYVTTKTANKIITISDFVADDVVKTFGAERSKFTTTYNSADYIDEPTKQIDTLAGKKFIMYVGRHLPHKNLGKLIKAHEKLLKTDPDLYLAIVGKKDASTELLLADVTETTQERVLFTGFVSDAELKWAYENTECYVFPSLSEGFGLPGLEAMVHGAPVASSDATCLPEVYGDAVLYFDPLDIEDMAQKISMVLNDATLREELIAKGKKQASKYSWKRMAEQTLAVYHEVLYAKK